MSTRSRSSVVGLLLLLAFSPSCGGASEREKASEKAAPISCFDPPYGQAPAFLGEKINYSLEVDSMEDAINQLNVNFNIPISFIGDGASGSSSGMKISGGNVREALRRLVESLPGYQCRVVSGHVVVLSDNPEFYSVVRDVDIVNQRRAIASRSYIEKIAEEVSGLRDMSFLYGGIADAPLFVDKVTLSREATVLEHFAQLLGRDQNVYFWIRRAATGSRYFALGSV